MGSKAYGGLAYATHTHEGHNNRGAPEEAVANDANTEPNPALALSLPEVDGGPENVPIKPATMLVVSALL